MPKGSLMPNTKLPLENIVLDLRNKEIQNKKFNFILQSLINTDRRRHLKGVAFLRYLVSFEKLL